MDDQKFEQMLERVMKQDFSVGTEKFRDNLLKRCLEVLDEGEDEDNRVLYDSDLEMLAAAGDPFSLDSPFPKP